MRSDSSKTRRKYLLEKLKETNGNYNIPVTIWGEYYATGEGVTLMLAYTNVSSKEQLSEYMTREFGSYYSRCCDAVYGFYTSDKSSLSTEDCWLDMDREFARLDVVLLSQSTLDKINNKECHLQIKHMSHFNYS